MADADFAAGQKVVVRVNGMNIYPGEIVSVGRTLVMIQYGPSWITTAKFRMDTQCLNDKNYRGYQTYFRTEAQEELTQRTEAARDVCRAHGLMPKVSGADAPPLDKLEAVAQLLELWPQEAADA